MSLNAYKISLKFYTSYLNNKLQQIIHSYISLLKYHRKILRNLAAGKSLDRKLVIANPAIWSRHITKQFLWLSTSTVTPMLNFQCYFFCETQMFEQFSEIPPNTSTNWYRFRVELAHLRSKINTFWSAFFTAKIQIWQKYLNRHAITLPRSHTIYICT